MTLKEVPGVTGATKPEVALARGEENPSPAAVSVELTELEKRFAGQDRSAVQIDDLRIDAGQFVTFVGPSGCGKSTTMRMIAGLEQPSGGDILFDDRSVIQMSARRRNVAMVFQNYALYPNMTVQGNLEYGLRKRKVERSARELKVKQISEMLRIERLLKRKPKELSGGEQQRVALGRAIIRDPNVLLLDEPLSNLDAELRTVMRAELVKLQRESGCTTVFVTHDQLEAMTMSDRIAVMNAGRLQQYDVPEVIYNAPANLFVAKFMGSPAMNFFEGTLEHRDGHIWFVNDGLNFLLGRNSAEMLPSESVVLGVRPEHVRIGGIASDLRAVVVLVELVGSEKYVMLESNAGSLRSRVGADVEISPGDQVLCGLPSDKLHLFEKATGGRVTGFSRQ